MGIGTIVREFVSRPQTNETCQESWRIAPLALREVESARRATRDLGAQRPCGAVDAALRPLPYPFERYLTIASDCDNPRLEALLNVGRILRERYRLPIADSYFGKWLYARGYVGRNTGPRRFDRKRFLDQNASWLRAFHRGWFDVLHNWIPRLVIKIADDVHLGDDGACNADGIHGEVAPRCATLDFHVPPLWHDREPPRYLVFGARLPLLGSRFEIRVSHQNELLRTYACDYRNLACSLRDNRHVIDLQNDLDLDAERLHQISFQVELSGPVGSSLVLSRPTLISDLRGDIAEQIAELARYNVAASVYTSHGGGYHIGQQGVYDSRADEPRAIAELAENVHYALDLFQAAGIEFFNTASNTSTNNWKDIRSLAFPRCLNGGQVVYDFHRAISVPRKDNGEEDRSVFQIGGKPADYSHADFLGHHLHGFLNATADRWSGGVLYTHSIVRSPLNPDRRDDRIELMFNEETHRALGQLQDRYWNISGSVSEEERVYVAPTSVLLRHSQVLQELPHHAWYQPDDNAVHITSWRDPITGRVVPEPDTSARELRGQCFYVDDSHTANVYLDGRRIDALVRNPPDRTGRESVTVVDTDTPVVVLGRWSDDLVEKWQFERLSAHAADESGGHTVLELAAEQSIGQLRMRPRIINLDDQQHLLFSFRKRCKQLRFHVEFIDANGSTFHLTEDGFQRASCGLRVAAWESTEPRTLVVPLTQLFAEDELGSRRIPSGRISSLSIALSSSFRNGDGGPKQLSIDRLHFLRDSETPSSPDGFLLGGLLRQPERTKSIVARSNGICYPGTFTADGQFLVMKKIARGNMVELVALDDKDQVIGRESVEVQCNLATIEL